MPGVARIGGDRHGQYRESRGRDPRRPGLVTALVLLIGIGISPWVELLFPVWILTLSIDFLIGSPFRSGH